MTCYWQAVVLKMIGIKAWCGASFCKTESVCGYCAYILVIPNKFHYKVSVMIQVLLFQLQFWQLHSEFYLVNLSYHWDVSISFLTPTLIYLFILLFFPLKQNRVIGHDEIQVRTPTVKTPSFRIDRLDKQFKTRSACSVQGLHSCHSVCTQQ